MINVAINDNTDEVIVLNNTLVGIGPRYLVNLTTNNQVNKFCIKNNIFYKEDLVSYPKKITILFKDLNIANMVNGILGNNLHYVLTGNPVLFFVGAASVPFLNWDENGVGDLPLFTTSGYTLQAASPAINKGILLTSYSSLMMDDRNHNKRPYWTAGVDIGAYEFSEATVRIGQNTASGIEHTLTPVGASWQRNNGTWELETSPSSSPVSYNLSSSEQIKEKWDGFRFNWMLNSGESRPITHRFYKISNDNSAAYFYLDLRDAVSNYNPNVFIDFLSQFNQYYYWNVNAEEFYPITNGDILRLWKIAQDGSFSELPQYDLNVLIPLIESNHPRLVWGPFSSNTPYYIYRKLDGGNYVALNTPTLNGESYYTDPDLVLPNPDDRLFYVYYETRAGNDVSNEVRYSLKFAKENSLMQVPLSNNLMQNYPNPFNPTTTIHFSLSTPEHVVLVVYDILGREVHSLINRKIEPGEHEINFDASHLSSGVYICKLTAGKYTSINKMQLIK